MPCHTARARRSEVPITTKKKRLMMKIVIVDDDRAAADALAQKLSTFDETQLCGIALRQFYEIGRNAHIFHAFFDFLSGKTGYKP